MARTTAPLLSFDASGTIAKTQVYSRWRGISYVRRHVTPANPRTAAQQAHRALFRNLNAMWVQAPPLLRAPWTLYSTGRPFVDRNAFVGQNTRAMSGEIDARMFIASPGARGGLPPVGISADAGSGVITLNLEAPDAPPGWSADAAIAVAFLDFDPTDNFGGVIVAAMDETAPFAVALEGLTPEAPYIVSAFLRWTKPDGSTAYSPSLSVLDTPSA